MTNTMYNTPHVPFRYSGLPLRAALCVRQTRVNFEDTKTVSWLPHNKHFMAHGRGFGGFPTHPGKFVPVITRPQFYALSLTLHSAPTEDKQQNQLLRSLPSGSFRLYYPNLLSKSRR